MVLMPVFALASGDEVKAHDK